MADIAAKARVRAFDVVASMGLHTRRHYVPRGGVVRERIYPAR